MGRAEGMAEVRGFAGNVIYVAYVAPPPTYGT